MDKRFFHHKDTKKARRFHKGSYNLVILLPILYFATSCNPNEKVELTKEEKFEAHNTVLNRTPKLLDSLDKECKTNFVSNRQHFIDSILKVRLEKMQAKISTTPVQ